MKGTIFNDSYDQISNHDGRGLRIVEATHVRALHRFYKHLEQEGRRDLTVIYSKIGPDHFRAYIQWTLTGD